MTTLSFNNNFFSGDISSVILSHMTPSEQMQLARVSKGFRDGVKANLTTLLTSMQDHPGIKPFIGAPTEQPSGQLQRLFNIAHFKNKNQLRPITIDKKERNKAFSRSRTMSEVQTDLFAKFQHLTPHQIFLYGCYTNDKTAATLTPFRALSPADLEEGFRVAFQFKRSALIKQMIPHCSSEFLDKALASTIWKISERFDENLKQIFLALIRAPQLSKLNKSLIQATRSKNEKILQKLFDSKKPIEKEISKDAGYKRGNNKEIGLQDALCIAIRKTKPQLFRTLVQRGEPPCEMLQLVLDYANHLSQSIASNSSLSEFLGGRRIDLSEESKTLREAIRQFLRREIQKQTSTHFPLM